MPRCGQRTFGSTSCHSESEDESLDDIYQEKFPQECFDERNKNITEMSRDVERFLIKL